MTTSQQEKSFVTPYFSEMTEREIAQFLTCARVGRLGLVVDGAPYIVPVGFGYADGEIFFHTCREGLKMEVMARNPDVCFEADEAISDGSLAKSVVAFGRVEILHAEKRMLPYLQTLIDKYRVPVPFGDYMRRGNRNVKEELDKVRVCVIKLQRVTGRKLVRSSDSIS